MPNVLSPVLRPIGLDPSEQYDTAAQGAREAQGQANALSQLQWQRQMQGLQGALGYVNNLQSLYNSIYTPGGGPVGGPVTPAAGGGPPGGPTASEMSALSTAPGIAPKQGLSPEARTTISHMFPGNTGWLGAAHRMAATPPKAQP